MSRLTEKKVLDNFKAIKNISPNYVASNEELIYDKLGKLEDLEEEIGCPLDVVEKLFRQDFIYFKYLSNVQTMKVKVIKGLSYGSNPGWYFTCIYDNVDFIYISLRDYKKTWWLKKDKSE